LLEAATILIASAARLRPRWLQDVADRAAPDTDSIDDAEFRDAGAGNGLSAGTIARFWATERLPNRRAAISALTDPKHKGREHAALADRCVNGRTARLKPGHGVG
jgi:hypothetical protein